MHPLTRSDKRMLYIKMRKTRLYPNYAKGKKKGREKMERKTFIWLMAAKEENNLHCTKYPTTLFSVPVMKLYGVQLQYDNQPN